MLRRQVLNNFPVEFTISKTSIGGGRNKPVATALTSRKIINIKFKLYKGECTVLFKN